ncbi:MAG: hypothetical protein ACTHOR_17840 [Devosia sp.]
MSQKPLIISTCMAYGLPLDQAAYVLATADWETAHTLEPITERGSEAYLRSKPYYPWIGRGFVQLTWKANYQWASGATGVDLIKDPNKALDAEIAAKILVLGMRDGKFTGKKLSDYIGRGKRDFVSARRIVNGTDRATEIAILARKYVTELAATGYGGAKPVAATMQPAPIPATPKVVKAALEESGSRTLTAADAINKVTVGAGTATGLAYAVNEFTNALSGVPHWVWIISLIAVAGTILYFTNSIVRSRIDDALSGAHIGRDIGLVPAAPVAPDEPAQPEPAPASTDGQD